jgi:triosephosphate isomerase (TIM)
MKIISRKIIAGNWKMNLDYKQSVSLARSIYKKLEKVKLKNDVLLFPDFLSFSELSENFKRKNLFYGVQDVSPFKLGSYTGEVALESLKKLNCSYILVGHSERRKYFDDDSLLPAKIENILSNSNIDLILCIGEKEKERREGKTLEALEKQLRNAFFKMKSLKGKRLIIAYEPVWAIGSGKIPDPSDVVTVHEGIVNIISKIFKVNKPKELGILYGGSVNTDNFQEFKNIGNVSGLLIGGTSLIADDFVKIVDNF